MFQSFLMRIQIVILSRNLIAGAVIELRGARAGVVGHRLGVASVPPLGRKFVNPVARKVDSTCRRRWAHQDGKGFNVKLDYLPLNGAEIVIREPRAEGGRS